MKLSLLYCIAPTSHVDGEDHGYNNNVKQKMMSIIILHLRAGTGGFVMSKFEEPVTAAELMMDNPAHFVSCPPHKPRHAHSDKGGIAQLELSGKICPLSADVELQTGRLYLLLPMQKLNGRFSPEERAACLAALVCHVTPETITRAMSATSGTAVISYIKKRLLLRSPAQSGAARVSPLLISTTSSEQSNLRSSLWDEDKTTTTTPICKPWTPKLETIPEVKTF